MNLNQTKIEKINELKLNFSNPINAQKLLVLVEGEDDYRLFKKLFNVQTCVVEYIPGGKTSLSEGLSLLLQIHRRSIGIQDADFMHFEGKINEIRNLFLTDFHDMEIVMASCSEVLSALLHEYLPNIQKTEHSSIFDNLLNAIKFTAYLRFVNHSNDLQINFKGISFAKVFDNQRLIVDNDALLNLVISQSPNAQMTEACAIKSLIQSIENEAHDLKQLCNGHDLVKVIGLYLVVTEKEIAKKMRTAYRFSDFEQTQLFEEINAWAKNRNIEISPN